MKWLLLALAFTCLPTLAQTEAEKKPDPRFVLPFSGGGIRGALTVVADGVLVTPNEVDDFNRMGEMAPGSDMRRELDRPRAPATRSLRPTVPAIAVVLPQRAAGSKLKSPLSLAFELTPLEDAPLDPTQFKLLYGTRLVDISSRVAKLSRLEGNRLSIDNLVLPAGRHTLTLQVADEKKRVGQTRVVLEVE